MKWPFRTWHSHLGFLAILFVVACIYYAEVITRLPFGIHEWAQADRFSLALNFYDNGLNFFRPATNNLNSINGIVGVEFPIQSYIAALLGFIFGRNNINTIFRMEDVLISWAGLYFLFRIVYDRSRNFIRSIVAPLIIYCSPVFVFYSVSYLGDPAAVSISFIALFFLLRFMDGKAFRDILAALFLMTLAVLLKATTVTYWIGVAGYGMWELLWNQKNKRQALLLFMTGLACSAFVALDIWYISYLNESFHSTMFMSRTMPFESFDALLDFLDNGFKNAWLDQYFLLAEYPIMAFIMAAGIYAARKERSLRRYWIPVPFFVVAACTMFCLFGSQMKVHDYYVLAIFFPLIGYLLVISMIGINRILPAPTFAILNVGILAATVMIFFLSDHQNSDRFKLFGRYNDDFSSYWLKGGARLLDSLRVPGDAKILVARENAPNLSLVYFDRKGYVLPPDQIYDDISPATKFLNEKGIRYLMMRDKAYEVIRNKDSNAFKSYEILAVSDEKAVLRLK